MANVLSHDHGPEISETRARQGRFGWPVLWMLVVSTALAMLVLLGVWAFQWSGLALSNAKSTPPAPTHVVQTAPTHPTQGQPGF